MEDFDRNELLAWLGEPAEKPRRWLWRDGHSYVEAADDEWLHGQDDRHPVGAWWWRRESGPSWQVVPGRTPLCPPPEGVEVRP